jgi:hypothetical protein
MSVEMCVKVCVCVCVCVCVEEGKGRERIRDLEQFESLVLVLKFSVPTIASKSQYIVNTARPLAHYIVTQLHI